MQLTALLPQNHAGTEATTLPGLDLSGLDLPGLDLISLPTGLPISLTTQDATVAVNHTLAASSLISSIALPIGDVLGTIGVVDTGSDGGYLELNGTALAHNQLIQLAPGQLAGLTYVGSSAPGTDTIGITLLDATTGLSTPLVPVTITTVLASSASVPATDFNGDKVSDLLFQNADSSVAGWTMKNDNSPSSTAVVDKPGAAWHVVTNGDFNGDGRSDILVQNDDGTVGAYTMDGLGTAGMATIADPGASWHAITTGDFNGDGSSDIVFQNDNGTVATWTMNGGTLTSSKVLANPGASWHPISSGDFNGDGTSDIMLQNDDGSVAIWNMSGGALSGTSLVANPGTAWRAVGTGDFNGDGKSDILFQNKDGTVDIWTMNGSTIASSGVVANPGQAWHAVGTGDYNGDGKSDITFQNDDGTVAIWDMNGTSLVSSATPANPGTAWQLVGQGGVNFINGTQGTGTLTGTIRADEFVFTTSSAGNHVINGFDTAHDAIELSQQSFPGFAAIQAAVTQVVGGVSINLGGGSSLTLANVSADMLSAKNFV